MPCGVYISYEPGDQPWAEQVHQSLEIQGIPCRAALRDEATEQGSPFDNPEGSLILILSSQESELPRQLLRELDRVQRSGLELRPLRANQVHTPAGLGDFLQDLKRMGTLLDQDSVPSRLLQAVPNRQIRRRGLIAPGQLAPKALLEAPKTVSKRRMPAFAAAVAGLLFVGAWGIRASSTDLVQYEKVYEEQQIADLQAAAQHEQAHRALDAAERFSSQDRWEEADQALSKAIALDSGYAEAYFARGRARFWEHDYVAAIEDFNSVIRLDANLASGATTLKILAQQAQAQQVND